MMQAISAYTLEIDEPAAALKEIRAQLEGQLDPCGSTVGILQCDPEFIESGVVAHLCGELNFPIIGGTCAGQATNAVAADFMLTLLVLTGDDVEFVSGRTLGLSEDLFGATARSYQEVSAGRTEQPKLIIAFPPIIEEFAGDWYVDAFERQCGKAPVFGSLAVDDAITVYDRCATVLNGEILKNEMAYLLVYGEVSPRFFIATVPGESTLPEKGIITRAQDNIVYEINHMRAIDFFERVGLAENGVLRRGVDFVPFLMTVKSAAGEDERPFVRALIRFNDDGSATCRGAMYEGATFTIGSNAGADVLSSTGETIARLNEERDVHAALLFSCIVRRMTLGADSLRELKQIQSMIRPDIPFMAAYSGGEIAPTAVHADGAVNRFHNYSFIACLL
ncbi:FIST C-terminal domain-containing protein [Christensenellaceae bacterium OttesenSCG-928-M15]|nr:FIST C-terminal domain-containing protein [Christensenellaceae bacterium OttesenSCG-928-M15]